MDSRFILTIATLCWELIGAEKNSVSIIFGGDVDFSRLTKYNHRTRNCSYVEMLGRLKNYFKAADFAMINLETTIEGDAPINRNTMTTLSSEESTLPALKNVGINYVSIANNHAQDFLDTGLNKTTELLRKNGIKYSGIIYGKDRYGKDRHGKQEPLILKKNGIKIGILSYCDVNFCERNWRNRTIGPPALDVTSAIAEISSLRKKDGCDIVILFVHWGQEYKTILELAAINKIRDITSKANVNLIVGSHSHVVQRHWYAGKTLVAPCLGNLLFLPYGLANINFNREFRSKEYDAKYERIWYKQMKVMDDDTRFGRLLKVVFNRGGIVKKETKHVRTKIIVTQQHCPTVKKDANAKWETVCGKDDLQCTGTPTCNYLQCDDEEPLQGKLIEV